MGTPPTPNEPSRPHDREAALLLVANDMEQAFNAAGGRTLSDDETGFVFAYTLELVEHALTGAAVNGIITEEQRDELAVLIGGMRQAPRLV